MLCRSLGFRHGLRLLPAGVLGRPLQGEETHFVMDSVSGWAVGRGRGGEVKDDGAKRRKRRKRDSGKRRGEEAKRRGNRQGLWGITVNSL